MKADDWSSLRAVFERAIEISPLERSQFLDHQIGRSGEARERVEALLAVEALDDDFLEPPTAPGETQRLDPGEWIGTHVESFTILRLLAAGGMGSVYEAEQRDPKRRVALKVMHSGLRSPTALRRFRDEAAMLARLKHPAIAQVFEAGVAASPFDNAPDIPWFALELVEDARSLTAYAREEHLTLEHRIRLFLDVCEAVRHGHQRGVIHRDLKPENLLVDGDGRTKVIDFGLAKFAEDAPRTSNEQTLCGEVFGTLMYMSPEQIEARHDDVDTRADVYALGIVLYELACDQRPFDLRGMPLTKAVEFLVEQEAERPSRRKQGLPEDLDWIVAKATAKDLRSRYGSVDELASDLTRLLGHEPISARPPSTSYQFKRFVRRHRLAVGATALVLAAIVAGLVGTTFGLWRATRAEAVAEAERSAAVAEARKASAVVGFLVDVFSAPNPSAEGRDVRVLDVLTRAASEYGERFAEQPDVRAQLAHALGSVYHGLGLDAKSQDELMRALDFLRALHGGPHKEIVSVLGHLGQVAADSGQIELAESYLTESLEMSAALDPSSIDELRAEVRLGRLQLTAGRYEQAEARLRRAVEGMGRILGDDHRDTLIAQNSLAGVLHQTGRLDEAESQYRDAYDGLCKARGEDHPDTIRVQLNLAMLLHSRGDTTSAIEIAKELVEVRKETLGDHHPDTLSTMMNLAGLLQMEKRDQEALELYGSFYEHMEETLPEGHLALLTTRVNYGQLARSMGDLDRAEDLLMSVYEHRVETLGMATDKTLSVLRELAGIALENDKFELALERASEGLTNAQAHLPRAHHLNYMFKLTIGEALTDLGLFADAEAALLEAKATYEHSPPSSARISPPSLSRLYDLWDRSGSRPK